MIRLVATLIRSLLSINAYALSCPDVNGASVDSADGTYLGFFGSQFASESILNTFGSYGSSYSSTSIRNTFSAYGNSFGTYSANNRFATRVNVPRIYKNGTLNTLSAI